MANIFPHVQEVFFLLIFFWVLMQARVNVHGSVTCKEKCGPSVSVVLVGAAGDKKTVVLTDESSQFLFSDILPGKYRVEVGCIVSSQPFFSSCVRETENFTLLAKYIY